MRPPGSDDDARPLGLGLVGFGAWGRTLAQALPADGREARFVAAVSRDPRRDAEQAAALRVDLLPDLDALLAHPGVSAVVLATPHSLHAPQAIRCAEAGVPVLVEKPFALALDDAVRMLRAGRDRGVLVAAGHNRRFLPGYAALRARVVAGDLGVLLHVEAAMGGDTAARYRPGSWRTDTAESPAGGLAGSGIHLIDLMVDLLGPFAAASAESARIAVALPMDDTTGALLRARSGASATLVSLTATAPTSRFQVYGSRGWAELRDERTLTIRGLDGSQTRQCFEPEGIERRMLEAFASAARGDTAYPIPEVDVLRGVAAFEAIVEAARTGRRIRVGAVPGEDAP